MRSVCSICVSIYLARAFILSFYHSLARTLILCLSYSLSLSRTLARVVMMKSKELKTKISHAHSLILSHTIWCFFTNPITVLM